MYKAAGEFLAKHPEVARPASSQETGLLPNFAVIYFRERRDGQRNMRVFRWVKTFRFRKEAEKFYRQIPAAFKIWFEKDQIIEKSGDERLVEAWVASQDQLNIGVDPYRAATYVDRSVLGKNIEWKDVP